MAMNVVQYEQQLLGKSDYLKAGINSCLHIDKTMTFLLEFNYNQSTRNENEYPSPKGIYSLFNNYHKKFVNCVSSQS